MYRFEVGEIVEANHELYKVSGIYLSGWDGNHIIYYGLIPVIGQYPKDFSEEAYIEESYIKTVSDPISNNINLLFF
jgi:hypothetical protein